MSRNSSCRVRGLLSLWTHTPMFRLERGPLLITTLAIALAREAFCEVEFVTDFRGADIGAAFGWSFDSVNTALERFEIPGCEYVWAAGKLEALRIQTVPCVQFDGDVLLLNRTLPGWFMASRLAAQSPDYPHFYLSRDMETGFGISGLPRGFGPYNAGLIGGSDVALVQDYAASALDLVRKFAGRSEEINGTTVSMLCEQYHLGAFASALHVSVGTLLPMHPTREDVRRVGYAHLAGANKRDPFYVARAEARLRRDFPAEYERFLAGWDAMLSTSPKSGSPWCSAL